MEDSGALMIEFSGHGCLTLQSVAAATGDGKMCVPLLKGPGGEGFGRVLEKSGNFLQKICGDAVSAAGEGARNQMQPRRPEDAETDAESRRAGIATDEKSDGHR